MALERLQQVAIDEFRQVRPDPHREHERADGDRELINTITEQIAGNRTDYQFVYDTANSDHYCCQQQDRYLSARKILVLGVKLIRRRGHLPDEKLPDRALLRALE